MPMIVEIPAPKRRIVVGLDVGRLIFGREFSDEDETAMPVDLYHCSPLVEWSIPAIWTIVRLVKPENVFIIKNAANTELAQMAFDYLEGVTGQGQVSGNKYRNFFEATGMLPDNYFSTARESRIEKRYMADDLQVTDLFDDRALVHRLQRHVVRCYWFRPLPQDVQMHKQGLDQWVRDGGQFFLVIDWPEALAKFLEQFTVEEVRAVVASAPSDRPDIRLLFERHFELHQYLP